MKSKAFSLLFGALLCTGAVCYAGTPENSVVVAPKAEEVQAEYEVLRGNVGSYPITMYLNPGASVNRICGYLIYDRVPQSQFKLKMISKRVYGGMKTWGYTVVIYEYTPQGKHSGTYRGDYVESHGMFHGTFTNVQNGKKFQVNLSAGYY